MDETTLGKDMTDESGQAEKSATRTLEGALGERMQAFLEALGFLTVFPVSGLKGTPSEGVAFFPLVGFLLGALYALLWVGPLSAMSPELAALALLGLDFVLTRGLHLDGLADTFDGLFATKTKNERLAILDDTRIGSFGVFGIVFGAVGLVAAVSALPGAWQLQGILGFPLAGRLALVQLAYLGEPAKESGLGYGFLAALPKSGLLEALLVGGGLLLLIKPSLVFLAWVVGITFLWSVTWAWVCQRAFGGITGDTLGCHAFLSSLLYLVSLVCLT
ncbi:MAG: adenosylcobinamide-GDP ribazoletransferase [Nitrospirota bacterium]|nr:adenosylcobinamide-GDP ribazoletransferase [Nitrospirota bacterium]